MSDYLPISLPEKLDEINIYEKGLRFYRKYHKNFYNKLIHIVCIPNIVSGTFGLFNHLEYTLFGSSKYALSSALFFSYMTYYSIFAPPLVVKRTFFFYLLILLGTNHLYGSVERRTSWIIFVLLNAMGWTGQLLSHKYIEKRSPAFLKGAIQSLTTGPIFVVDEIINKWPLFRFWPVSVVYFLYLMRVRG
jgi:uncharacterized membrane protein YGL010W